MNAIVFPIAYSLVPLLSSYSNFIHPARVERRGKGGEVGRGDEGRGWEEGGEVAS